ncbi:MAG: orotate phosphoribosyltransferase [Candidatus Micrarchaeota archaeon]|nr:orotate phosphoribosyltransferase [Candidatus Micrarchaeota archaeon]MBU1681979.1 orotate phosphoribosyltransferase [Candidatus Micrarchaeota archaeon]
MNTSFIEFLARSGAVKFGEFTLKSGRESPYFISTGVLADGSLTYELGKYYAQKIKDQFGTDFDAIYGPAYKGIPLAVATCIALQNEYGINKPWIFDRKEKKLHGDRGAFVGGDLDSGARIILVDDVMTTGGTKVEAIEKIKSSLNAELIGVIIAVDRMERSNKKTAIEEFTESTGVPVHSIENIKNIFEYLKENKVDSTQYVTEKIYQKYVGYMKKYGL